MVFIPDRSRKPNKDQKLVSEPSPYRLRLHRSLLILCKIRSLAQKVRRIEHEAQSKIDSSMIEFETVNPVIDPMDVLAITILVSTCLAAIFIVCFFAELKRPSRFSSDHDSLLPFDDE